MSTPENIRYHAAGHLAAAAALIGAGHTEAARVVLNIVQQYINSPTVKVPPAMHEKLNDSIARLGVADVVLLEDWFVHPFNTVIEKSQ